MIILLLFSNACTKRLPETDDALIIFSSDRSGSNDIYAIDENGKNLKRLTNTPKSEEMFPVFSPDGEKIAYLQQADDNIDIIVMNLDGTAKKNIFPGPAREESFEFSRDSKRLAFISDKGGDFEIYTIDVDGSHIKKLTDNNIYDVGPIWSLDDTQIFWGSAPKKKDGTDIFRMDANGSNSVRYTNNKEEDGADSISFDGKWLANTALRGDNWQIILINADNKKQKLYTNNNIYDASPVFNPKDHRLLWLSQIDKHWQINIGDARQPGKSENITKGKGNNFGAKWSPDGNKVIFESDRSGNWHIYTMNPDGTGLKQLTKGDHNNRMANWRRK